VSQTELLSEVFTTLEIALDSAPKAPRRRQHRATKHQPLSRSSLDGRTNGAKIFDRTVSGITNDLGGPDNITTIQSGLIEAYAGAKLRVNELNVRLLLGQEVSLTDHALAISSLVRVASQLGVERRARDITPPTLNDIARDISEQDDSE
jgi:hypothetical protein